MQELYEQLIAYYRSYADAIPPTSRATMPSLLLETTSAALCFTSAVQLPISAAKRYSPSSAAAQPTEAAEWMISRGTMVPNRPFTSLRQDCGLRTRAMMPSGEWLKLDNVPAERWSPTDKLIWENAAQVLAERADQIEGGKSGETP